MNSGCGNSNSLSYAFNVVQVIDHTPELRQVAMDTLCCMVTQLGQRYKIFIPIVRKVRDVRTTTSMLMMKLVPGARHS